MKILAFAASNSKHSINHALATYAANLFADADIEILKIHDYEMPIFSMEREQELGQPEQAKKFFNKISSADVIIIAFAEHNGTYTATYTHIWSPPISQGLIIK